MAVDPVVIRFAAAGVADVTAAFERVSERLRKFEEGQTRSAERGARTRESAAKGEARAKLRVEEQLAKDKERLERKKTTEEERELKRREALHRRSSEAAGRFAAQQAREEERQAERVMRVRIRSSELAGKAAAREAAEEIRQAERVASARERIGRRIGGVASRSVAHTIGGAASMAGAAIGLGGGFFLADRARKQIAAEQTAALLVNAGTSGGVAPGTVGQALGQASAVSKDLGISKEALLGGALKYAQSAQGGDFQGSLANMGFIGKLAAVSGSSIDELSTAAGILQSQNKDLQGAKGAPAMQRMLLNALAQSHSGSMSLADAAKQIGVLGSTRSFYSQDEGKTQQSLIGLGQIARRGGDTGEAGTFVKDFSEEMAIANKKWKEKTGHELVKTDEFGRMASPEDTIAQVFRGTKGNIQGNAALLGKRASILFTELEKSYIQGAGKGNKNVEGGIQSALAEAAGVTGSTMSMGELDKQFAVLMETPGKRLEKEFNRLAESVGEKLEPKLAHFATETAPKLVSMMEKAVDAGDKFASWFADNPIRGIGAVIGLAVAKDIAGAGIGAGVKAILSGILSQSGGFGGFSGAKGGIGKAAAGVGLVGTVAAAAWGASQMIDADTAMQQSAHSARAAGLGGMLSQAGQTVRAARGGTVTGEQLGALQENVSSLKERAEKLKQGPDMSFGEKLFAGLQAGFSGGLSTSIFDDKKKENERELKNTIETLKLLQAALRETASAVKTNPPPVAVAGSPVNAPITQRPHG